MIVDIQAEVLKIHLQKHLEQLLQDKTTKANIIWATDAYTDIGKEYHRDNEIRAELITREHSDFIKNRATKELHQQSERTRQYAEVFTPLWICEKMNDHIDEVWFNRKQGIHKEDAETGHIKFTVNHKWKHYVDSRRLEITCGEAPYLVSRYDVSSGEAIPLAKRTGILDRKLRAVNENAETEKEWVEWAIRAFQATYGYEFQGDNLLIARVNLLMSFEEYLFERWNRKPTEQEYNKIINIICWNIWQMDGLTGTIPYCKAEDEYQQMDFFSLMGTDADAEEKNRQPRCRIYDWRRQNSLEFLSLNKGERNMKFDYIIGNPPYQESGITNNKAEAIYHYFYDVAARISDKYLLISPARFLFNAGLTPKDWNKKMLSDTHLKVIEYYANSSQVFTNTNINGGVAIVYRDATKAFHPIGTFIPNDILRKLSQQFKKDEEKNLTSICFGGRSDLKLNEKVFQVFPDTRERILHSIQEKHPTIEKLAPNEEYEIKSSSFERTPFIFLDEQPIDEENYYKILGLSNNKRIYKWVKKDYLSPRFPHNNNINKYKVLISNADGAAGQIGKPVPARILGKPIVAAPNTSSIPTFMSIGCFESLIEAQNAEKYVRTKFTRVLIGILKITQHITPATCAYVPLQDFTPSSDIDWSKSIPDIDRQLYAKYGLDEKEIEFIESHVKEMA